ncbi:MerR family transcriptional regulator [Georgenia alba]|uniref:MerR family transcriptional regulator n=1 Tax=Georgenia alba TaxID=2233858 RepID=A0ABW2QEY4_9MICO
MTTERGDVGPSRRDATPQNGRAADEGSTRDDAPEGLEGPHNGQTPAAPLTVAGVASRLGVAASTLRTWDRRYGLGPSAHVAGAHRKYTPDDVARLERMRQLTLQGVAPSDAARAAVAFDPADPTALVPEPPPPEPRRRERLLVDALSLAAAAVEPDAQRVERMLEQEVADQGVVRAWTTVAEPALAMLGRRDKTDLPGVEPEAVLRAALLGAVRHAAESATHDGAHLVLLCAAQPERLAAHVLAGGLAEIGVRARVLAVEDMTDADQILGAAERRRAGVLAVLGDASGTEELVRAASDRDAFTIYLLGDETPQVWLPRVHRVRTLAAAVEELAAAARAAA